MRGWARVSLGWNPGVGRAPLLSRGSRGEYSGEWRKWISLLWLVAPLLHLQSQQHCLFLILCLHILLSNQSQERVSLSGTHVTRWEPVWMALDNLPIAGTGPLITSAKSLCHYCSMFIDLRIRMYLFGDRDSTFICNKVLDTSVTQLFPTLCDPMNCSTPGLPVHHQLPEFTQTHAHRVDDAIQPSHPLLPPSPPAPNPSQHQGLFQWVSSSHEVAKVLEFQLQHQSFQWTTSTDLL